MKNNVLFYQRLASAVKKVDLKSKYMLVNSKKIHLILIQSLSFTYTPKTINIKDIILKYWYVLNDDPKLNGIFNQELLITYKRASNIKNRVVIVCSTKQISQNIILLGDGKCGNCEFTKKLKIF